MRLLLTVVLLSASVLPCPLGGQVLRDPIQAPAVSLGDWDLTAAADVRFGRVALINGPDGSRLELRKFASTEPSRPSSSNRSHTPSFDGNTLIVADFSRGNRSPLGGYFGTFQRAPSVAEAGVEFRPDGRQVLGLDLDYRGEGFCGSWVQLYDNELSPAARSHLDSRGFSTLSFWIRGREGGERVLLKVADPEWEGREDALAIGEVSLFLPSGRVDTHWQQGVVALDRFPPGIRRDALALIVFEGLASGTEVELGPIGFSLSPTPLPDLPPPTHRRPPERPRSKGTWVWNTASLLRNPTQVPPLLDFLEGEGFDHVFLQLPTDSVQVGRPGELTIDVDAIRGLVGGLNARGMKVYALDGYAGYALPGFHAGVLSTIDHVVEYNREVAPGQRFFGVRYDIEPYLLPSFHGPNRENLLTGLLQLTEASVKRAHDGGLV
ncbi:MAG: hypothetical protein KJN92_14165, partial [Gemmatimonadetes bacterium]|nr:hypothetical protein [Gemmatimonadota bacterium]